MALAGGVENGAGNGGGQREAVLQERILGLESQVAAQSRRLDDMETMSATHGAQRRREFQTLNGGVRRVATQPVARQANNQEAGAAAEQTLSASTPCPNPPTLCNSWEEQHEPGMAGRKTASLFATQE